MTRNEFEQVVDRCIAGEIIGLEIFKILDQDTGKQWLEGEYIYLDNIAQKYFYYILDQGIDQRGLSLIKQILSSEKSCFFSTTLRMPSNNSSLPPKARWLLDLVNDSEWATLRELIIRHRETRFLSPDIRGKYWEMACNETFEGKTIIDLMKQTLYHNVYLKDGLEMNTKTPKE